MQTSIQTRIPPKEKAKEIFETMHSFLPAYAIFSARDCSVACAKQIKSELMKITEEEDLEYWEEVVQEIKKF